MITAIHRTIRKEIYATVLTVSVLVLLSLLSVPGRAQLSRPPAAPPLQYSPQFAAEIKTVQYVAAELRKLGLEVQLEKVMVPHWVRGEETAALTDYPGMARGTTQKIVLTALGGSVATPNDGLTEEVVVV